MLKKENKMTDKQQKQQKQQNTKNKNQNTKPGRDRMCSGKVNISCLTCATHRIANVSTQPVIYINSKNHIQ